MEDGEKARAGADGRTPEEVRASLIASLYPHPPTAAGTRQVQHNDYCPLWAKKPMLPDDDYIHQCVNCKYSLFDYAAPVEQPGRCQYPETGGELRGVQKIGPFRLDAPNTPEQLPAALAAALRKKPPVQPGAERIVRDDTCGCWELRPGTLEIPAKRECGNCAHGVFDKDGVEGRCRCPRPEK